MLRGGWAIEERWQRGQQRAVVGRTSSSRIFCTMNVATVLDSSLPISMVRRHSGMISVDSRKLMTSESSTCRAQPPASAVRAAVERGETLSGSSHGRGHSQAHLHQCANDAERGEAQVLKRARLAHSVEERVEEERHVSCATRSAGRETISAPDTSCLGDRGWRGEKRAVQCADWGGEGSELGV